MWASATLVAVATSSSSWAQGTPKPADDTAGVTTLLTALVDAYNKADAKALEGLFDPPAVSIDADGVETQGAEAIVAQYAQAFGEGPTAQMAGEIVSIRFPLADLASISGNFELLDAGDSIFSVGRFGLLAARKEGKWRVVELRDDSVVVEGPASNEERLQELAWMVGDWVDESDASKVETKIEWAENRNFLIRRYSVEIEGEPASTGTQWIGWDPSTEQIKSWVFDSEGGHGSGTWTSLGDAWVIKATGVLRNGDSSSATQVIQKVNDDVVRFRSTERVVGGELLPDIDEVVMVRKAPAPAATAPK